jgi:predicted membrane protein
MNMSQSPRFRGPIFPAIVLIGLGVLFLLTENHILNARDLWRLWPLLLLIAGLAKLSHGTREDRIAGVVMIALGLVFQASELGYLPIRLARLWPLALVGIGFILLGKSLFGGDRRTSTLSRSNDNFTMFGGVEVIGSGDDFEGTVITVLFGGYSLDLRKAVMKGNECVIDATAIFGGVDIQVPVTWNVVLQGSPVFGGYSDESLHPEGGSNAPQLIVRGTVIFGGVSVKN